MSKSRKEEIGLILSGRDPGRFAYAPNYWQWFAHQKNHGILPEEIRNCQTQLDLLNYLGVDVFSRNVYSSQNQHWIGGLCEEYFDDARIETVKEPAGKNTLTRKKYHLVKGILEEQLLYQFEGSTIIQEKYLITDYSKQLDLLEYFVAGRKWRFNKQKYESICDEVGDSGIVIAGEFFSPLKMLHFAMGPVNAVYFLMEHPEAASGLLKIHEETQLGIIRECITGGVKVVMSMDNLDTMFHPPDFIENYSASFYERASALCHEHGARFFIHACGNQKANLKLIDSLGVDGLEGFATPPMGDMEIEDALRSTSDRFIITGGITPLDARRLQSGKEVNEYVSELFRKMTPFRHRFIFSSGCNTAIDTTWETIKRFRDAWEDNML